MKFTGCVPNLPMQTVVSRCRCLLALGLLPWLWGCLLDSDKLCGERFVEAEDGSCVCPPNHVVADSECRECGKNEEAVDGQCRCENGFERSPDGACEAASGDDEPACSSEECPDAGPACSNMDGGICAKSATCTSSLDCEDNGVCDIAQTPQQCVPPPTGYGNDCSSDDDCAEFEADYCEVFSSRTCIVARCAEDPAICPGDWICCRYDVISTSLCVPPSEDRPEGNCPEPGVLVEKEGR